MAPLVILEKTKKSFLKPGEAAKFLICFSTPEIPRYAYRFSGLSCVIEEATDKKISEVSVGLLNVFLKGNQSGAYRSICQ